MGQLPVVSGDQARKVLEQKGWVFQRQNGSHMVMTKHGSIFTIAVPRHKELAVGTLRRIIRDAQMTVEEFVQSLR